MIAVPVEVEKVTTFKNKEQRHIFRHSLIMIGMIAAATGIGWVFRSADFPETNIVIVYLLSILMTARLTPGYAYGIAASVIATFAFNYFFASPYYTLSVSDPSYLITFVTMTITSFITSALTSRVKKTPWTRRRRRQKQALCSI